MSTSYLSDSFANSELLGRPPVRQYVRSSILLVMFFFFFSARNLRDPSADRRETLPRDRNLCQFYNASPKIRGFPPPKIGGQNMQKFGRFLYNLTVWSPERVKISKIGKLVDREQFLLRSIRKRLGELWCNNYRELDVRMNPLKCTYLRHYIKNFGPYGVLPLKFLHALETDQALLAHTPRWTGSPPQKKLIVKI